MDFTKGSSSMSTSSVDLMKCECGLPVREARAKTAKNLGRRFFGCSLYKFGGNEHCKYFKWADEAGVTDPYTEIREKDRLIAQLHATMMDLRRDIENRDLETDKLVFRQRVVIACLTGILVCTIGALIFR